LDAQQVEAAMRKVGIDPEMVYEVGDWKTTSDGFAVAFLLFPGSN
jgi:hypothetical protein